MSAPMDLLKVIDSYRPLVAAASVLGRVNGLPAHDALRQAAAELIDDRNALLNAVQHIAASCDGRAAEVAKAALEMLGRKP